ncbi:hypothetical protein EON65_53355 [archaeon]|nr:MAG: hypothetical protein EON65_53355 [archaeon]
MNVFRCYNESNIIYIVIIMSVPASHDITHISASTARRMLHHEGLHAMHTIKKPLLTREHRRKRLEFVRKHRDWTVQQWKQVIFSDETVVPARSSDSHKVKWTKPGRVLTRPPGVTHPAGHFPP